MTAGSIIRAPRDLRSRQGPNAEGREAQKSTLPVRFADVSYRAGSRKVASDAAAGRIRHDAEADAHMRC